MWAVIFLQGRKRCSYTSVFLDFSFSLLRKHWLFHEYWINLNHQSTCTIRILQFEVVLQLKFILQAFWTVQSSTFTSLVFSSQIQQFSRFYNQHSKLYLSVNLFLYSFILWFHCGKLVNIYCIYTLNTLCMIFQV